MSTTTLRTLLNEAILAAEGTVQPVLYYRGYHEIEDTPWLLDQPLAEGWGLDCPSFIAYTANNVYYQRGHDGYCMIGCQSLALPTEGNML
jgi:hypothetical protein